MSDDRAKYFRIIKEPVITEKAVTPRGPQYRDGKGRPTGEHRAQVVFWVDRHANKIEIKEAIEKIFEVKVERVRTATIRGKVRRVRYHTVTQADRKKAYITLKEGEALDFM